MTFKKYDHAQWDLAGLTTVPRGFSRPLPLEGFYKPSRIVVDGNRLVYSWRDGDSPSDEPRLVRPNGRMLEEFVRLGDASQQQVLRYARRWGVLYICEHNVPASHNFPTPGYILSSELSANYDPDFIASLNYDPGANPSMNSCLFGCSALEIPDSSKRWIEQDQWEPLDVWRRFARQARAMLNIAAHLHQGRLGQQDDWHAIYQERWTKLKQWHIDSFGVSEHDVHRMLLTQIVNEWLELGNVRPIVYDNPDAPRLSLDIHVGQGLFGHLAVQLMAAVSRTEGLALCTACGGPYLPTRRPRAGENHYCPECGRRAAQRNASRRYRERKHAGRTDQG